MPAVVDHMPQPGREVEHLVDDWGRVVAGDGGGTPAAVGRLVVDHLVGREDRPLVLRVPGLAAAGFARRGPGRGRLPVRAVGRGRAGRVGRVLAEPGFRVDDAGLEDGDLGSDGFQRPDIRLHGRRQGGEHVRG